MVHILLLSERISIVVSDSPHCQRAEAAQGHEQLGHAISVCQDEGDYRSDISCCLDNGTVLIESF